MKLLFVCRSIAYWGGIERVWVEKMNHLASVYGNDVYLITTDQGSHLMPYKLIDSVHWEDINIRIHSQYRHNGLSRLFVVWRLLTKFRKVLYNRIKAIHPDIIVCTTSNYFDINVIAKAKNDIPLVVESHSILCQTLAGEGVKRIISNYMFRKGFKKAYAIVALTEADADEWRVIHPCVKVIPNVVHINNGELSSLENKQIIWVGRFDCQKQPMEIVEIWKLLFSSFPDWHLNIYGEGDLQGELDEFATSVGMNIHVHMPTSNILSCYRQNSILVSTSLFEPFGMVIPEAMSCGLPVVAYDCPFGPINFIQDGNNGFLIRPFDRRAFAVCLGRLMNSFSLRYKMGRKAVGLASHYSKDNVMPLWRSFFEEILRDGSSR